MASSTLGLTILSPPPGFRIILLWRRGAFATALTQTQLRGLMLSRTGTQLQWSCPADGTYLEPFHQHLAQARQFGHVAGIYRLLKLVRDVQKAFHYILAADGHVIDFPEIVGLDVQLRRLGLAKIPGRAADRPFGAEGRIPRAGHGSWCDRFERAEAVKRR